MANSERLLSFEEQSIFQERGLLPEKGDHHEPLSMGEVRRRDFSTDLSGILDEVIELGLIIINSTF